MAVASMGLVGFLVEEVRGRGLAITKLREGGKERGREVREGGREGGEGGREGGKERGREGW